jgi:hypothetical protein
MVQLAKKGAVVCTATVVLTLRGKQVGAALVAVAERRRRRERAVGALAEEEGPGIWLSPVLL